MTIIAALCADTQMVRGTEQISKIKQKKGEKKPQTKTGCVGEVEALENTTRKQTKPKQCPAYIRAMIASVLILHYKVEEHFSSCFNARNVIAFNPYSMQDMEHKSYEHCVFCQVLPTGSFD